MDTASSLHSLSPIDGRYHGITSILRTYFSEAALIRYRVFVEIQYIIYLSEIPIPPLQNVDLAALSSLNQLIDEFDEEAAFRVKEIEKTTRHDVKAVEYYLREKFEEQGLQDLIPFIHFGLTSQDINNTAIPLSLKEASGEVFFPAISDLVAKLKDLSEQWKGIPMLARTHGQAASPTQLGKEIQVFVARIEKQYLQLLQLPFSAKFGGATGNFNAHVVAFPNLNWPELADHFVEHILQLSRTKLTTQIEPYDDLAAYLDGIKRILHICIDLCRDVWHYISLDYFTQSVQKEEVGSSVMPHKVNPIDFENAEGNFLIAAMWCTFMSSKLPISRLQRDLTDSTVLRNIGMPLAHAMIALDSLKKGLNKLNLNEAKLQQDLQENWAVVAEGIQTILRREGIADAYEQLKDFSRKGRKLNRQEFDEFIEALSISEKLKQELRAITPFNYTGRY